MLEVVLEELVLLAVLVVVVVAVATLVSYSEKNLLHSFSYTRNIKLITYHIQCEALSQRGTSAFEALRNVKKILETSSGNFFRIDETWHSPWNPKIFELDLNFTTELFLIIARFYCSDLISICLSIQQRMWKSNFELIFSLVYNSWNFRILNENNFSTYISKQMRNMVFVNYEKR